MWRALILVTVGILCVACAGLVFVSTLTASGDLSIADGHSTAGQPRHRLTTTPHPSSATPPNPSATTDTPVPAPDHAIAAAVEGAMQAVLPNAQVGFEVFDRQTNMSLTSQDADQQFASMSVVKLLIALDTVASDNWATPDDATQQRLRRMLADSDDGIAGQLWAANGGPALVTRMVDLLGLTGTQPPDNPGMWGDTLITAQDMVTVYRYITDQLPNPGRDLLLGALADAPQVAADGFDQYFGIPDGMPHTTWAIKQGWGTSGSQAVMHSTGLVGADLRYVVVLLVSASANSYSTVPAVVTAGAHALAGLVPQAPS